VQFAAVEKDGGPVACKRPEAACACLDVLDLRIEPFCHRICNWMEDIAEQPGQVLSEHSGLVFYRLQTAAYRPAVPILEKLLRILSEVKRPKLCEHVLDSPRSTALQATAAQQLETFALRMLHVL